MMSLSDDKQVDILMLSRTTSRYLTILQGTSGLLR